MAPRINTDPVPQIMAGIVTMKCECGWEMIFIMPEEQFVLTTRVLAHLRYAHCIEVPQFDCQWH